MGCDILGTIVNLVIIKVPDYGQKYLKIASTKAAESSSHNC